MTTVYEAEYTHVKTPRNVTPWYVKAAPALPKILAWVLVVFLWTVMLVVFRINMVPYSQFFAGFAFLSPWMTWIVSRVACGAFQVIQVWPQFVSKAERGKYRRSLKYSKYAFILEACFSFVIWWPEGGWLSLSPWAALYTLTIILITVFGCSVSLHLTHHYLIKGGRD